jgi:hypothetical protein
MVLLLRFVIVHRLACEVLLLRLVIVHRLAHDALCTAS